MKKLKDIVNEDFAYIQCQDDSGQWINYSVVTNNFQILTPAMRTLKTAMPDKRIRAVDEDGKLIDII